MPMHRVLKYRHFVFRIETLYAAYDVLLASFSSSSHWTSPGFDHRASFCSAISLLPAFMIRHVRCWLRQCVSNLIPLAPRDLALSEFCRNRFTSSRVPRRQFFFGIFTICTLVRGGWRNFLDMILSMIVQQSRNCMLEQADSYDLSGC